MSDEASQALSPGLKAPAETAVAGRATDTAGSPGAPPLEDDALLIAALRRGDEDAFMRLVEAYSAALLRLARMYVSSREVAEEVVQETWLGVLRGLDRFEGRSSLKTWIFHILTNTAKTRAVREGRSVPFSALAEAETESDEPAVEPERFQSTGGYSGAWVSLPRNWGELPEQRLLSGETLARIREAIQTLPEGQRMVITLRDVDGCSSEETRNILGISETNQRVLLHRARIRVRRALERYLDGSQETP